jgi:hypothetical protein
MPWAGFLLGARGRPRGHAAEQRDERAAPHSITSSARTRNDSEITSPIDLAVLRLTSKSLAYGISKLPLDKCEERLREIEHGVLRDAVFSFSATGFSLVEASSKETRLRGWACRTRTQKCRRKISL